MKQTKKCPFCSGKIEAQAVRFQFCGSDLSDSMSVDQEGSRPRKALGRRLGLPLAGIAIGVMLIYLREFLPEDIRQWLDWFLGEDMWYRPTWIIIYAPVLL